MFDIRRISKQFGLIFFLEIVVFLFILYLSYSINDESQRIIYIGSIVTSLIVVLLTTSLVYYNYCKIPEMAFTGFLVEPMLEEGKHAAKTEYLENVSGGEQVRNDVCYIKYPKIKKVECESSPSFLKLRNDITNLGLLEGHIHEIRYYCMNCPKQEHPYILPKRCSLLHQQRKTIELPFPISKMNDWGEKLKKGVLIFKFEVIGATKKFEKEILIHISDDLKTIKWSESKLIISITKFWIRICPPKH